MSRSQSCENPLRHPSAELLSDVITRLRRRFAVYAATCPAPLPAPGLVITPEIRYQSELYLPLAELRPAFYCYYRASLTHPPIVTSTPVHRALSWADCYAGLPAPLQLAADPGLLLQRLLSDADLHERFIYDSFLPARHNGAGFGRYPAQLDWLRQWARMARGVSDCPCRCLDAACGSGEGCWELAEVLHQSGWQAHQARLEGWTLDPLEVHAATYRSLPHLPGRQLEYRKRCATLSAAGWDPCISFRVIDLMAADQPVGPYDLILCNGLLGGPLLNRPADLHLVVGRLVQLLRPGGWLLAANRFHGGWRKQVSVGQLSVLFGQAGLEVEQAGEGIAGRRI